MSYVNLVTACGIVYVTIFFQKDWIVGYVTLARVQIDSVLTFISNDNTAETPARLLGFCPTICWLEYVCKQVRRSCT